MIAARDARHNPLLAPMGKEQEPLPFATVKSKHFIPAIREGLKEQHAFIDALIDNPDEPTFENTIEAMQFGSDILGRALTVMGALSGAKTNRDIIRIQRALQKPFSELSEKTSTSQKLFDRIEAVYNQRDTLNLTAEQKVLLENTYKSFAKGGIKLPKAQQKRLQEINLELSRLTNKYSENTTKSTAAWSKIITDETELDGVPERAKATYRAIMDNAKEAARKSGQPEPQGEFMITLSPPPMDIFDYATNRALREEVYKAYGSVGRTSTHDNTLIIPEIVRLRFEKARLLGYKTYADMVLSERMAGSVKTVNDFLAENLRVYKHAAKAEREAIRAAAAQDGITQMKPWDSSYYSRIVEENTYNFKSEELRPYFSLDKVQQGMFDHARKLFNIDFKEDASGKYPVYDEDMKTYEVFDNKDGRMIGVFYTDFFARAGEKRNGAWMNGFQNAGVDRHGNMQIPHVINVCNFPKPAKGKPALLSMDEVRTLFHEFGHGLHGLLGEGRYEALTGTNVKWDFVELPSQLQENWTLEKSVVDSFAVHYQTGAKLPDELFQRMIDASNFGAGLAGVRQSFLGMLDMKWNGTAQPGRLKDVAEVEGRVSKLTGTFNKEASLMSPRFGHIFSGGYAAGYYSYKWAEVLDADVFETKFKKEGLYNRKNADELRSKIYAAGGTRPPMELFVDYMGREPDPEAMFRREGITIPPARGQKKAAAPAPQ